MSAWNPYEPRSNDLPTLERIAAALERIALAIEARSAGTCNRPGPKGESAGPKDNARKAVA